MNVDELRRVSSFPVVDVYATPYVDSTGADSLEAWVVMDDSLQDNDITGERVMNLKGAILDRLQEHDIRPFPHIRVATQSVFAEMQNRLCACMRTC